eukprot:COSAG02_NODE_2769_length_8063_cov_2.501130_2_plen_66_part_00
MTVIGLREPHATLYQGTREYRLSMHHGTSSLVQKLEYQYFSSLALPAATLSIYFSSLLVPSRYMG